MVEAVSIAFTLASVGVYALATYPKKSVPSWVLLSVMVSAASTFIVAANEPDATGAVMILVNLFLVGMGAAALIGGNTK